MNTTEEVESVRDASKAAQAQIVAERAEGEYMIMQRRGERWEFFSRYSFTHEYGVGYIAELRIIFPTTKYGLFKVCVLEEIGESQLVQVSTASTSEYTAAQRWAEAALAPLPTIPVHQESRLGAESEHGDDDDSR